jgi:hypothetical protein
MSKKTKTATAEATPKPKVGKLKQAGNEGSGTKANKARAVKTPDFDFVGKVESIRVNNAPGQPLFTFGLKGRNGMRRSFQITSTESFALTIMAPIVTAAHAAETKIGVRVGDGGEVVEVQCRPRLGKNG